MCEILCIGQYYKSVDEELVPKKITRSPGLHGIFVELLKMKSQNFKYIVFNFIIESWNEYPLPNDQLYNDSECLYKHKGQKGIFDN